MTEFAAMRAEYWEITTRLFVALAIGAAIGMERSYSGRAAGFRTHSLVAVSTALLMLVTVYEHMWINTFTAGRLVLDPTRIAQGIMTGIGFLGAGAIIKSGYTIHGLTTAASIWITAAIGILVGIGFYFPALLGAGITLGVLTAFRWIEAKAPSIFYAHCVVRFARDAAMPEDEFRAHIARHGFAIADVNYRLNAANDYFEYRTVIRTRRAGNARALTETFSRVPGVKEFRLSPTGD
jgi:putative Mg2+ transporter-C (MgtC) family protein